MSQDELGNVDVPKPNAEVPPTKGPDRTWKIWYWDENDKQHILYIKAPDERDAVNWCKEKFPGWNWTIFNDKGRNVNNNGVSVKI